MAVQGNDFEGGTNGANVTTTSIASSGFGYRVLGTGSGKFTTDSAHGSLAVSVARASNSWFVDQSSSLSTNDVSFSFFFRYKTALPNDNDYLLDARTAGGSLVRIITTASTGIPFLQISGGAPAWTSGTALVVNTWYRLDVRIHVNASTGYVFANFYTPTGTTPLFAGPSLSGVNTGSSVIVNANMGPFGVNAVTVGTFEFDDPRFDATQSSAFLGPATPTDSGAAALTQASTLVASAALARTGSVALTNISIMANGPAIWDDYRYVWDDSRISWDDNAVVVSVALTNASVLAVLVTAGSATDATTAALTSDSILSVIAFAYSGDVALLIGPPDLEWVIGNADAEWTSASSPAN